MENNNQNLNNQVNTNNNNINQQASNNTNKIIFALMALVIVVLAGYIVYTKFIQKDDKSEPKQNNTQEQENNSSNQNEENNNTNNDSGNSQQSNSKSNIKLEGLTFKTSDGKNILRIVSKNDKEALKKAEQLGIELNDDNEEAMTHRDYFGYYNNVLFLIYDDEDSPNNSKYKVLGGQEKGRVPQCRDTHEFVINLVDNTLVNFSNLSDGRYYKVHNVGDKYYFSEGGCAYGFRSHSVYNEQLKRVGDHYFNSDKNGNFYVLDGGYVVKYDRNENIIGKNNEKFDDIYRGSLIVNDSLYFVAEINSSVYLVDTMGNQKYKLDVEGTYSTISGSDGLDLTHRLENNLIKISTQSFDEEEIVCTFDIKTKTLVKNNSN